MKAGTTIAGETHTGMMMAGMAAKPTGKKTMTGKKTVMVTTHQVQAKNKVSQAMEKTTMTMTTTTSMSKNDTGKAKKKEKAKATKVVAESLASHILQALAQKDRWVVTKDVADVAANGTPKKIVHSAR